MVTAQTESFVGSSGFDTVLMLGLAALSLLAIAHPPLAELARLLPHDLDMASVTALHMAP